MKKRASKIEENFKGKYKSLNKEQKEAVDSINGPVMVIAGPGTGKTSVLTLRIANILRLTDTLPESILALTFTESGAISMRNKLFEIIGESAFRVKISTFHGFANEIIQNYPEYFPKIVGGNVASSLDKVRIIEKIIESNNFKTIKPSGDMAYYVKPIEKAIGHLKSEGFDAKSFSTWLKKEEKRIDEVLENKFLRSRELSIVFELYEKEMSKLSLYDYDDMLIEFIKALENHKNLLLDLEENYLYIMADEHQDANNNQNKILELLTSYDSNPNLFIVGDENQSIFRFQGASLENFLYFKNRFKKVKVINLIQNYRSSQKILDASFELINNNQKNSGQKIKLLSNHKKEGAPIFLREFENDESEFNFIAQEISNLIKDNPDEKIAVIYRSNDDTLDIVRKLDKMGIGFSIKSDDDIFTDIDIDNLITFLKAIDNPLNSEFLSKVLFFDFLKIPIIPALKAIKEVGFENNLIEILNNPSKLNLNKKDEEILKDFSHHLLSWSKDSKNLNLEEFIDKLVRESGFANKILAHKNTIKKLDKFRGFYSILRSTVQSKKTPVLGDFLSDLNLAKKFDLKFESSVFDSEKANVFLMTAHKSKGLEFDTVFLIKGNEEKWSKKKDKELFLLPLKGNLDNDDSDEKKLFYVVLTRAKHKIYLTYSNFNQKGRNLTRSSFIETFKEFVDEKKIEMPRESIFYSNEVKKDVLNEFKNYINISLKEYGLSVTALNNFINCPSKFLFQNLLRMPHSPEKHQNFGTAIHYAIKMYQKHIDDGLKSDKAKLFEFFKEKLSSFRFSKNDLLIFLERGKNALDSFFVNHSWQKGVYSEYEIKNIIFNSSIGEIPLKGDIDEMVVDDKGKVTVVDFKTGKPKTRNYILGKTKDSKGDIYRQLLFYKFIVEQHNSDFRVDSGVIEFVEPDEKGNFKSEFFNLKEENLNILKEDINNLVSSISSLDFFEKKCDEKDCEFCEMSKVLYENLRSNN